MDKNEEGGMRGIADHRNEQEKAKAMKQNVEDLDRFMGKVEQRAAGFESQDMKHAAHETRRLIDIMSGVMMVYKSMAFEIASMDLV